MEEKNSPNQVVVNKRGRKKKMPDEIILTEYKNVSDKEFIWLEIFGEDEEMSSVCIKPKETVFLSERDLRKYNNDLRFIEGRIVPVGSNKEIILTKEASDIMTDEQIVYFIKNISTTEELETEIEKLNSVNTITRMIKEAKTQDRSYSFVSILEEKLNFLVTKKMELEGKNG